MRGRVVRLDYTPEGDVLEVTVRVERANETDASREWLQPRLEVDVIPSTKGDGS